GFAADTLTPDFSKNRERWQAVQEQLQAGSMPPKEKPRPPAKENQVVRDWIAAKEAARRAAVGRVGMRRLNNVEYQNTIRDLLAVQADLKEVLPEDTAANGFDNNAEALHVSSFLMEQYLEAADRALNAAIANGPKPALFSRRMSLKNEKPSGN